MSLEHAIHLPKKRTIIKDRVGCVKTSTYDLPKDGFSYGRKSIEGVEGAGESKFCVVISLLFADFDRVTSYLELGHRESIPGEEECEAGGLFQCPSYQTRVICQFYYSQCAVLSFFG